ncbi:cyclic nucleotide-gated cation channel 4 [Actinidia rufa]|uniref:Cyclic nucleotide-gated cation channel 4 n=1 Tax=Actinidia rufa TaxID=165716 RepID=A0A7J0G744_9ERIC|nr:cyclic nucleotide-gated cation channel 4 [Actinidia rufa]
MASDQEVSLGYHDTEDEDEEEEEEEEEDDQEEELERSEECKSIYTKHGHPCGWSLGRVLDPQAPWIQEWNHVFHLMCATGLFVDPLFFYALSISDTCMCLFVDGWFAVTVTVLRCMTDAFQVWNILLQLKMNYLSYAAVGDRETKHGTKHEECSDGRSKALEVEDRFLLRSLRYTPTSAGEIISSRRMGLTDLTPSSVDLFVMLPVPLLK